MNPINRAMKYAFLQGISLCAFIGLGIFTGFAAICLPAAVWVGGWLLALLDFALSLHFSSMANTAAFEAEQEQD